VIARSLIVASLITTSLALADSAGPPLDPIDFSTVAEEPCDPKALIAGLAASPDDYDKYYAADVLSIQGSVTAVPALEDYMKTSLHKLAKRTRKPFERILPVRIATLRDRPPWPP